METDFPHERVKGWFEDHGGRTWNSSAILENPDLYDNPIGYAVSFNYDVTHSGETLEISYWDGNHPSGDNSNGMEFNGEPGIHVIVEESDIPNTGWFATGERAHNIELDGDSLSFTDDGGNEIRIIVTEDGFRIYENDEELMSPLQQGRPRERGLNPNTKYFRALPDLPDGWFTSKEADKALDVDFYDVKQSLEETGALEKRKHPEGGPRKQWRITEHGREELDRLVSVID